MFFVQIQQFADVIFVGNAIDFNLGFVVKYKMK
jgi:hypothetical protein